ncbi:glycine zipper domain-containing protein [Methylobacter psychrophilus]|uniref:glycine zipper domain-containing protein n=1 Tax=Methylobacter psychrophilus TaxID=96941 RepID=UPI0021D4D7C0|nr:DUF883 domain-containing protein [Methylobacter psychrophilus]
MEIIDKAANSAHESFDKFASTTHQAPEEALGEKGEQLKNSEQQLLEDCRVYVRDNPITSVGIAVAAGFLLNRVLSGR